MKRTPLRRQSAKRSSETRDYAKLRREYLAAHPLCQATLREEKIPEEVALSVWKRIVDDHGYEPGAGVRIFINGKIYFIPISQQIHHRNKRHGSRLTDTRWFLAVSFVMHGKIEDNKTWARERGYLLNISADPDGFTPAGVQALTTDQLMKTIDYDQPDRLSENRGIPQRPHGW